jgi:two-component system, OmpR family, sensor histidine kinase CpxA
VSVRNLFPFRSLFFKIFVSFWLTMALTIAVLTLMARISNSESFPERASRGPVREGLTLYSETAVRIYEREGPQALQEFIRRSLNESGTEVFLFDGDGKPIAGGNTDGNVANVVHDLLEHPEEPPRPFSLFAGVSRTSWGRVVASSSGKRYIFAVRFSQRGNTPPFFTASRIAVSILIAGLVCYLLGLYLTLPLKKLQSTVKALAEGDLDVRVSPELAKRRDELAELGREFDHMAEQIAALISSQKRLLADISHELRSPLARLAVALELARKNSDGRAVMALDRIEQEAERVNKLVGQLLAITRLESGAERVPPEMVVLEELVQQVIDDADFEAKPRRKGVRAVELEQCRVRGSSELLSSAVENVIRNAIRYTAPGTDVEVWLRWRLDTAVLSVRDHGPGVPESELEHIFEPFYRVSEARERASGGVGLGLSIAERTVKLHGGSIRAENVPGGLQITIELPLAPMPAPAPQVPEKMPV